MTESNLPRLQGKDVFARPTFRRRQQHIGMVSGHRKDACTTLCPSIACRCHRQGVRYTVPALVHEVVRTADHSKVILADSFAPKKARRQPAFHERARIVKKQKIQDFVDHIPSAKTFPIAYPLVSLPRFQ